MTKNFNRAKYGVIITNRDVPGETLIRYYTNNMDEANAFFDGLTAAIKSDFITSNLSIGWEIVDSADRKGAMPENPYNKWLGDNAYMKYRSVPEILEILDVINKFGYQKFSLRLPGKPSKDDTNFIKFYQSYKSEITGHRARVYRGLRKIKKKAIISTMSRYSNISKYKLQKISKRILVLYVASVEIRTIYLLVSRKETKTRTACSFATAVRLLQSVLNPAKDSVIYKTNGNRE